MSQFINIDFSQFFDRTAVTSRIDPAERRVLSKAGSFVRQRARSLIRRRRRVSNPGDPPSSHSGLLRRLIFFAYDRVSSSVVVGPLLFRRRGTKTGAELLEFGGTVTEPARTIRVNGPTGGQFERDIPARRARYRERPYMFPALLDEAPNFPTLWKGQVT